MHSQGNARQRVRDPIGVRHHVEEIGPIQKENIQFVPFGGQHHLRCRQTRGRRNLEAPLLAQVASAAVAHGHATGEGRGVRPHFCSALNAGVTANGHQSGAVTSDVSAGQGHVHDGANAFHAVTVLGDTHAPNQHRSARAGVHVGESLQRVRINARIGEQFGGVERREMFLQFAPTVRVRIDEVTIDRISFDEQLQQCVG